MVQRNEDVAFVPRMCVEQQLEQGTPHEIAVKELQVERKVRLIRPAKRTLSHAAKAFLEVAEVRSE